MEEHKRSELAALIDKFSKNEGINDTLIPGVSLFKTTGTDTSLPSVYNPCLFVIAQGRKQAMLDKEVYRYGPGQYLIVTVDLPVLGQVTEASIQLLFRK